VHVISRKPLTSFWRNHRDAEMPLRAWFKAASKGSFKNVAELKRTFSSVDYVPLAKKQFYVFNVGGNKYRLIAVIHFNTQKLFVRYVMTLREYDRGDWKK
jgi:mRNA interferase HigB